MASPGSRSENPSLDEAIGDLDDLFAELEKGKQARETQPSSSGSSASTESPSSLAARIAEAREGLPPDDSAGIESECKTPLETLLSEAYLETLFRWLHANQKNADLADVLRSFERQDRDLMQLGNVFNEKPIDNGDKAGFRALVVEILGRFPPHEYVYVSLGASADPIAIGLRLIPGCAVAFVPLSGIPKECTPYENGQLMRALEKCIAFPWDRGTRTKVVVLDACQSGGALWTMADQFKKLAWCSEVVAFALNRPMRQSAAQFVNCGQIQVPEYQGLEKELVMLKIFFQIYKEKLGRLFGPKIDFDKFEEMPRMLPEKKVSHEALHRPE